MVSEETGPRLVAARMLLIVPLVPSPGSLQGFADHRHQASLIPCASQRAVAIHHAWQWALAGLGIHGITPCRYGLYRRHTTKNPRRCRARVVVVTLTPP